MITNRGAKALLALTFMAVGFGAHSALPTEPPPAPDLVRYEDGSGVLYLGDQEIATYPESTFVWHCESMGNEICGDVDDADLTP